jgi:predicted aspartyl protease
VFARPENVEREVALGASLVAGAVMDSQYLIKLLKTSPLVFAIFSVCACSLSWGQRQHSRGTAGLDVLLRQKDYIELQHALLNSLPDLSQQNSKYFQGIMANRTNDVEKSIGLLGPLLPTLLSEDLERAEFALCALADDYAKTFRYRNAAGIYGQAAGVAEKRRKESVCNARHEASRWALFADAPAQVVAESGEFSIRGKRDAAGLFRIPVTSENYAGLWIVDSGANLSVVSSSVASELGIRSSGKSETLQGANGVSVPVRAAVIPRIHLGPVLLRNVAVLVVADSDMNLSNLNYKIDGCLGLTVLAALGKITFHRDGQIDFSPGRKLSGKAESQNMFFENLTPLIAADLGQGVQLFTFDTGATGTVLSAAFYRGPFRAGEPFSLGLAGVGGTTDFRAYRVDSLLAKLGGACARIEDVAILTSPSGLSDEFYGNVGQSALASFSSFTLDFPAMEFSVSEGQIDDCKGTFTVAASAGRTKATN